MDIRKGSRSAPTDAIGAVSALDDPSRRRMYEFIRSAHRPVSREQAAESIGISRKLAAFHLDKLVQVGLLISHYDRDSRVHSVGRSPKVYEPAPSDFAVSVPHREPALLAELLLEAVSTSRESETARDSAIRVAGDRGRQLGTVAAGAAAGRRLSAERAMTFTTAALAEHGYEPSQERGGCLRLRSCPFHPLAERNPDVVCAMNHAFLAGFLTGLGRSPLQAVLDPHPGECCVQIRSA